MSPPHPRCVAAFALVAVAGVLCVAVVRVRDAALRFPPQEPPCTGVPEWRIDLDRAGVDELRLLPGVGPRLAERIVQDRERRGSFGGVDGLDRVPGVGPAVVERVRPFVR